MNYNENAGVGACGDAVIVIIAAMATEGPRSIVTIAVGVVTVATAQSTTLGLRSGGGRCHHCWMMLGLRSVVVTAATIIRWRWGWRCCWWPLSSMIDAEGRTKLTLSPSLLLGVVVVVAIVAAVRHSC